MPVGFFQKWTKRRKNSCPPLFFVCGSIGYRKLREEPVESGIDSDSDIRGAKGAPEGCRNQFCVFFRSNRPFARADHALAVYHHTERGGAGVMQCARLG